MDMYQSVIERIERHKINGVPFSNGQIHPFYNGFSIANLPDSICRWLAIPALRDNSLAEEFHQGLNDSFQHVIFVLVDGLSLRVFQRFFDDINSRSGENRWKSHFQSGHLLPLTSICPSTTSTALTSIWTGREPCEHGIIGYELFLKEFGLIANMITHSVASFIKSPVNINGAGFDPSDFLPVKTMGSHCHQHGVDAFTFQHNSIAYSGLSRMLFPKVHQLGFKDLSGLWRSVNELLTNQHNKSYMYVYWGGLDTLSHRAGPDSEELYKEWCRFAELLSFFIESIKKSAPAKSLLILTADHGQIATEISADYDLHNHPDLQRQLVMVPTGESRLPYLNIKPGRQDEVAEYLEAHWDGGFSMLPSIDIQASGLLGRQGVHQSTIDRMGSHVVFPLGNAYWWWVEKENHLLGRHGGLSAEEMLVPFFAMPL